MANGIRLNGLEFQLELVELGVAVVESGLSVGVVASDLCRDNIEKSFLSLV